MKPSRLLTALVAAVVLVAFEGQTPSQELTAPSVAFSEHNKCELEISDADALALIATMIDGVNDLEAAGSLSAGQANALRNHLERAREEIEQGQYCSALAKLGSFREQVGNFADEGVLDPDEAASLTGSADTAIEGLPNLVTIHTGDAAGTYEASGANFGPVPTVAGVSGNVVLVNDGSGFPTLACNPLVGFSAGAMALVDRGTCFFVDKVLHGQAAGAVAVIVVNSIAGLPVTMGGGGFVPGYDDVAIPAVMVSLDDGNTIKNGLPATATVSRKP